MRGAAIDCEFAENLGGVFMERIGGLVHLQGDLLFARGEILSRTHSMKAEMGFAGLVQREGDVTLVTETGVDHFADTLYEPDQLQTMTISGIVLSGPSRWSITVLLWEG